MFHAGWQVENLSPIAQLLGSKNALISETGSRIFLNRKTIKITLNFAKIIELHLNSSEIYCICIWTLRFELTMFVHS